MKDKEIIIQNLALELTRRCNLNCAHCMRGEIQNKVMDDRTIERVFEDIDGVYNLQFAGGETSLALDRLKKVLQEIKKNKTIVRSFVIFTNAVNISNEYIELLEEFKNYIKENNINDERFNDSFNYEYRGLIKRFSNEYPLQIVVSLDKYHLQSIDNLTSREKVKQNIEKLLEHFPVEIDKICNYSLYNEGNARNISSSFKEASPTQKYSGIYWKGTEGSRDLVMIGPIVTISHDGRIIDANKEYDYCDSTAIGCIHEESFYAMLKKLQAKKKFKLCKSIDELYKKYDDIMHETTTSSRSLRHMIKFYKKARITQDYSYFLDETKPNYDELKKTSLKK